MSNILGVHWIPIHNRPNDLDYIRRLQPGSVKIVDPDVAQISQVYQAAPNALLVLRDHPLSEEHDDMRRDPYATGIRHAERWHDKVGEYNQQATARNLPFPEPEQIVVLGINEPRVWEMLEQTVDYTLAFLAQCKHVGLRAGALNLSVGWPANNGAETPANWQPYARIEKVIRDGNHYLVLHGYWDELGPDHNWRWWAGRHAFCPWDVPIIIGECGIDKYVSDPQVSRGKRGWRGWLNAEEYANHLHRYATLCARDRRIHSIQPFTTDGASDWHSFDTEPAHGAILAKQWPKAGGTMQPTIPTGPDIFAPYTGYVNAVAGLNVRSGPGTNHATVGPKLPFRHAVQIIGKEGAWLRTSAGWVHSAYISRTQPAAVEPVTVQPVTQPTQPAQPQQSGIIDPIAGQAIVAVESGGQAFGPGGRLLIRFENHLFNRHTNNAHAHLFRQGNPAWTGHQWRRDQWQVWQPVHTGNQNSEWEVFEWAATFNRNAALLSISMGLGQILGSHFRRLGYASAEAMFRAFGDRQYGHATQMLGFLNFFLSDPTLFKAMRDKDFLTVARIYNGPGQAAHYAQLMQAAYQRFGGV